MANVTQKENPDGPDEKEVLIAIVNSECLKLEAWLNQRCENKLWHGCHRGVNKRIWCYVNNTEPITITREGDLGIAGIEIGYGNESLGVVYVYGRRSEQQEDGARKVNGVWIRINRMIYTLCSRLCHINGDPDAIVVRRNPVERRIWMDAIERELIRISRDAEKPMYA